MGAQNRIERGRTAEFSDLVFDTVGSQEVSRRSVGTDDAQGYTTGGEFSMQLAQHVCARKVEIRCSGEIADRQPDGGRSCLLKAVEDCFHYGIGIT